MEIIIFLAWNLRLDCVVMVFCEVETRLIEVTGELRKRDPGVRSLTMAWAIEPIPLDFLSVIGEQAQVKMRYLDEDACIGRRCFYQTQDPLKNPHS